MSKNPNKKTSSLTFLRRLVIWSLVFGVSFSSASQAAVGEKAMVVTSDSRATQAALEVIQKGGNAIDALVAAQAMLNVVEPQTSGIGGSGSLLFYDVGTRGVLFFDGSTKAPAKAYPEMFLQPDKTLLPLERIRTSGLATGVPSALKLLWEVHAKYKSGKFSFAQLLDPAIGFAEKGMAVSGSLSEAFETNKKILSASGYFRSVFLAHGDSLKEGAKVVQPDLAATFRNIQKNGLKSFYSGDISKSIVKGLQEKGDRKKLLEERDLEDYEIVKRDPLYVRYKDNDLFTAGPPSAGGVMLLAGYGILAESNLEAFFGKPEAIHLVSEAMKLSSRVPDLIGDPDLFDLPVKELLSDVWARKQASKIQQGKVYKLPPSVQGYEEKRKDRASATVLIRDKFGNIAAYAGTLGDPFGSGIIVPGKGFFLNDLLLDFDTAPGLAKDAGAPNTPGPGQRPRNFFSPVFVFNKGRPFLVLNSSSGSEASAVALNMLVQAIDFKAPCGNLIDIPRVFNRDSLMLMEKKLYDEELLRVRLELWGHKVRSEDALGDGQMICFEKDSDKIVGQADGRGQDGAAGF